MTSPEKAQPHASPRKLSVVGPLSNVSTNIELSENMLMLKHLAIFREYDKSGDGRISVSELKEALAKCGVKLTSRQLRKTIKEVDADGDNEVSFDEYVILARKIQESTTKSKVKSTRIARSYLPPDQYLKYSAIFQQQAGSDGAVSCKELQEFLKRSNINLSPGRIVSLMQEMDEDNSGYLEEGEFMILMIKALGLKRRKEVGPDGHSASELRAKEGWAIGELRKVGYGCLALREAGFSIVEVMDVCSASEMKRGGVSVSELLSTGWDGSKAREAGFSLPALLQAGADVRKIRNAGYNDSPSAVALRKLGVAAGKMKLGGWLLAELRAAGYSTAELRLAGFSQVGIVANDRIQTYIAGRGADKMHRQSTPEIRKEADKRFLEANIDGSLDGTQKVERLGSFLKVPPGFEDDTNWSRQSSGAE